MRGHHPVDGPTWAKDGIVSVYLNNGESEGPASVDDPNLTHGKNIPNQRHRKNIPKLI